jgi:hypothetical protein
MFWLGVHMRTSLLTVGGGCGDGGAVGTRCRNDPLGVGDRRGHPLEHIDELVEARRNGDDGKWDDIASAGVEVVVGGAIWELWFGTKGWRPSRPTQESEIGSAGFGEGDLIGTVGPATLSTDEIVRRIATLEFEELTRS